MCGIAGFTHKNWVPAADRIVKAVATLAHRGPDQQGVFQSDICSMGAARLKIIDLQGGNQPITSSDSDTTIVFNGEIYNHLELRKELEAAGHKFQSHCDTETVLHAFLEWDTECFARLRGMFAVALWTKSKKRLVLARDRMGIKPLYIAQRGHDLYFGSELKTILIHPEIERNLSLNGLDCYLSLNYVPSPWTLIDGIEKLPPAHWLEWKKRHGPHRLLLAVAVWRVQRVDARVCGRAAGFTAAAIGSGAHALGRASRRVAQRWSRFFHHPSLCGAGIFLAAEGWWKNRLHR